MKVVRVSRIDKGVSILEASPSFVRPFAVYSKYLIGDVKML